MRRIKLRRKYYLFKKDSKFKSFIIIFIIIAFALILSLKFINAKVMPVLLNYASLESRKIASIIINEAVSKNVSNSSVDELFIITKNSDNEIKTIDFNPIMVNKILTDITRNIQLNLKYVEKGNIELLDLSPSALVNYDSEKLKQGIIYEIPSGVIFGNSFLSNLGPKIPVRISLLGDIVSYINTKTTNYGINNAIIEINIVLEIKQKVILPFSSDDIVINTSIPIAIKLIEGEVPNYYLNGIDNNSSLLSVPIE